MNSDFVIIPNPNYDPNKPWSVNNPTEINDPLCEASKFWCENYKLNLLKTNFMDDKSVIIMYLSGFKSTLDDLKNYVEAHEYHEHSQQYFDELLSYQVQVYEYFPSNIKYQKLLKKYLFTHELPINFIKLEELFSGLNFKEPAKDLTKNKLFYEALRLVAYHQIAPPQWLADEMLNRFETTPIKHPFNINKKMFQQKMKIINNRPPSQSLEKTAELLNTDKSTIDKMIKFDNLQNLKMLLALSNLP